LLACSYPTHLIRSNLNDLLCAPILIKQVNKQAFAYPTKNLIHRNSECVHESSAYSFLVVFSNHKINRHKISRLAIQKFITISRYTIYVKLIT